MKKTDCETRHSITLCVFVGGEFLASADCVTLNSQRDSLFLSLFRPRHSRSGVMTGDLSVNQSIIRLEHILELTVS